MAAADLAPVPISRDWALSNPWLWTCAGFIVCVLALLWSWTMGEDLAGITALFLFIGLVSAGAGLALRLGSARPATLDGLAPPTRALLLFVLSVLFVALALAATAILIVSFFELRWFPWGTGQAVVIWIAVAPLSIAAARRAWQRDARGLATVTPKEEAAALLIVAALSSFVGCWALYFGRERFESWETIRLFLAVLTAVALVAAPLVAASPRTRRLALSLLFVLHFGGIATATLAAPPSPWIIGQLWVRVYRPYLEFMYLNNAYHFYAPEPGPASFLWCRAIYMDQEGKEHGHWIKIPRMDEQGRTRHSTALEYQRYLAMIENAVPSDPTPPFTITDANGQMDVADFYRRRIDNSALHLKIGMAPPKLVVPFHPYMTHQQQVAFPNDGTKKLVSSVARHVAQEKHPENAEWTFKAVKIYRARHEIAPIDAFARLGWDPNDPELYRPYYLGMHDADGNVIDGNDPFFYWLLPILREEAANKDSVIRDFCRKHAGDPRWLRVGGSWVEGN